MSEQDIDARRDVATQQGVSNPGNNPKAWGEEGEKMKAAVYAGKNSVKLVETVKPRILEPRDAIVKVTGTTICGSDLHLYHGAVPSINKGDILGHEFCGVVESVGDQVKKVKPGDRVVCSFQIACGDCRFCKDRLSSQCERTNASKEQAKKYGSNTGAILGYSHLTGGFAGGQAEYVRVAFSDVNLLKLPDDVPDEKGLYLSDVLSTSWHCVQDTGVEEGDVVAIWGAGPIGQMCAIMSFLNKARRVILIDGGTGAWRLDWVKERIPKVETLDYSSLSWGGTVPRRLREMTSGAGIDVALECAAGEYAKGWFHSLQMWLGAETDTSEILNEMIESCRPFGRCGITGVYVGMMNNFNVGSLMERGIRLIGNGQAPVHKYWEDLLKMIQDGTIDPLQMVTHRISIDQIEEGYVRFDRRSDNIQKLFIATKFSKPPAPGAPKLTQFT